MSDLSGFLKHKVIYVAGRFRGENAWEVEKNVRRAEEDALWLWKSGYAVVCPHTNTRFFNGAAPDEFFLEGDLDIMRRCDGVLMVRGWEESKGAHAERAEALCLGIPVFYAYYELTDHKW